MIMTDEEFTKKVEMLDDESIDIDTIFVKKDEKPLLIGKAFVDISGLVNKTQAASETVILYNYEKFEGKLDISVKLTNADL